MRTKKVVPDQHIVPLTKKCRGGGLSDFCRALEAPFFILADTNSFLPGQAIISLQSFQDFPYPNKRL